MMRNGKCIVSFACAIIVAACTSKSVDIDTISIDCEHPTTYCLDDENCIRLTRDTPMGMIVDCHFTDDSFILRDYTSISSFDNKSGKYLTSYSGIGRAEHEVQNIAETLVKDDQLLIFDNFSRKVVRYSLDGVFIGKEDVGGSSTKSFQFLCPYIDGTFLGRRVFGVGEIPEISVFDSKFEWVNDIETPFLKSGSFFHNPLVAIWDGRVLYNQYFNNTVYYVEDDGSLSKAFSVDFGRHNIPESLLELPEYEIIQNVNNSIRDYATLISNIYESKKYLCFTFLMNPGKRCFYCLSKADGEDGVFLFNGDDMTIDLIRVHDDKVYLFAQQDEDTLVHSIDCSELVR